MRDAVVASGCELVTVAVRRIDLDERRARRSPTTCPRASRCCRTPPAAATAEEAVRVARLARAGGLPDWIKLEVIPDPRYLLPDPVEETLQAAAQLVGEGFTVLPYVQPDPVLQRKLEAVGCATVMPLAVADRQRPRAEAPARDRDHGRAGRGARRRRRRPRRALARRRVHGARRRRACS